MCFIIQNTCCSSVLLWTHLFPYCLWDTSLGLTSSSLAAEELFKAQKRIIRTIYFSSISFWTWQILVKLFQNRNNNTTICTPLTRRNPVFSCSSLRSLRQSNDG